LIENKKYKKKPHKKIDENILLINLQKKKKYLNCIAHKVVSKEEYIKKNIIH
jgi:hypothetical protein